MFSIPSRLFGDYVQPELIYVWEDNTHSVTYTDDGEGNTISSQVADRSRQHYLSNMEWQLLLTKTVQSLKRSRYYSSYKRNLFIL
jgi:hypothetical protein